MVTVGIIGMGVVGQAQSRLFASAHQVTYDPAYNDRYPRGELAACDFAIICTGTPALPDGHCDLAQVWDAVASLPGKLPVMIRSTVPPGTTDALASSRAPVVHVPEFLHERPGGDWKESSDVPFVILGGTPAACAYFRPFLEYEHTGKIYECPAREAELIKYTANLYGALRVTFVNEMAHVCEAFGVPWEAVRAGWLQDPRIGSQYTGYEGFPPGFGGACWPKDLAALIAASRDAGYAPWFLQDIRAANERFRAAAESPPRA